jgi:poly-gamma-glutamate synthesis protein (capsule biosynthesis protein)
MAAPLTLLLGGDVMTGRGIDQVLAHPGDPALHEEFVKDARDYVRLAEQVHGAIPRGIAADYVWGDALDELRRADLRIVNLETAVTRSNTAWPGKGIHYRMHPDNVACLTAAGLDACVLANNHVLDWGREGLAETLASLSAAGLRTAGAGTGEAQAWAPLGLALGQGRRLLLLACATASSGVPDDWAAGAGRSGLALLPDLSEPTALRLADHLARQRRSGDLAMLSIHWGGNWGLDVPDAHRLFAHTLIERGAVDLVHGHSSHHPLPLEVHRGRLIVYGCGDLLNDYEGIASRGPLGSDVGCLYRVGLAGDGAVQSVQIVPMRLRRFRLERADAASRDWVADVFDGGRARFGTSVERAADNSLTLRWATPDARTTRA